VRATLTEGLEDAGLQAANFSDPGEALRPLGRLIAHRGEAPAAAPSQHSAPHHRTL
jgi:hypothetical protein